MENCWFRLKQTHFPPPTLPTDSNGVGKGNGAICPGHTMASLKDLDHMDNIINRSVDGFTFTPAVPIYNTGAWKMQWEEGDMHATGFSADAQVPIAELVGLSAQAKATLAFKESVQNYRAFDKLDRYIILPTRGYIKEVLEDEEVQSHIDRSKSTLGAWSILMVTGVAIARGSHGSSSEIHERSGTIGGGAGLVDAASADVTATASSASGTSMSTGAESDFVWAVRVSKIWKGTLDRTWSFKTQSKGATFSLEDEERRKEEVAQALEAEGTGETNSWCFKTKVQGRSCYCLSPTGFRVFVPSLRNNDQLVAGLL
ncbi:hypothetical protein BDV96DRAFT_274295 [Lophiotrema nucula]|uniref:Uncharacterized protein n=1 Tax=Lophiotrema nucula TaxID=690887 RepID=A0A6A5ZR29_9PLEO|nr:hypothetical protein BDV96DRAFT_274295 [Lophiotrema nucula]